MSMATYLLLSWMVPTYYDSKSKTRRNTPRLPLQPTPPSPYSKYYGADSLEHITQLLMNF